jgi:23S rRNA pseudouridine1911/1915/1917 synthase
MRPAWEEPAAPLSFALLHRDAHLLAVLKPAGLPTLPGGGYFEHTLLQQVRRHFPDAAPVHRIGRGTTGLVLCARSREAAAYLSTAWAGGRIRKFYRALVCGHPAVDHYRVEVPIGLISHRPGFKVHAADPAGKPALSHVQVLERREEVSLVQVEIVTGRAHQARIHLAASGHPLVGDPFYREGGLPRPDTLCGPGEGGFHLHSHRILLTHPVTRRPLTLEAPPPPLLRGSSEN